MMENELSGGRDRKQDIAYDYLKEKIINNEFKPGTYINENDIVDQLTVSKTPVREAIQRLINEKLLVNIPGKGTYVSKILIEDIIAIYDLRAALDGLAVKLCIYNINEQILKDLKDALDAQKKAIKENNYDVRLKESLRFLNIYIMASENDWLIEFTKQLEVQIDRISRQYFLNNKQAGNILSVTEYIISLDEALYQAIESSNAEKAEEYVKKRWIYFKDYYFEIFKKQKNL